MSFAYLLLVVCTMLYVYAAGGCWLLQVVCYPTYHLVGSSEFVPFHLAFGRRLIPVFVVPAILACLTSFVLVFVHPVGVPLWALLAVAACSIVILSTTMVLEVPKHNKLDRDGKSTHLIDGLVQNNIPRVVSWTIGSAVLVWLLVSRV